MLARFSGTGTKCIMLFFQTTTLKNALQYGETTSDSFSSLRYQISALIYTSKYRALTLGIRKKICFVVETKSKCFR